VGQFLAQYANLLATQGALQTALYYLASSASLDSQVWSRRAAGSSTYYVWLLNL
jgi:hypothetical protein